MDKNNEVQLSKPTDLSESDLKMVANYFESGMPGFMKVDTQYWPKMKKMYMNGASYHTISNSFGVQKKILMAVAHKEGWFEEKREHIQLTVKAIDEGIPFVQTDNIMFLIEFSETFKDYYRKRIREYQKSGDDRVLQGTSLKALESYLRCFKLLQDSVEAYKEAPKPSAPQPSVHVHVGEGSNVTITDGGQPPADRDKKFTDVLQALAELKKQREESE